MTDFNDLLRQLDEANSKLAAKVGNGASDAPSQIRGKAIDGELYVRAADIADHLDRADVLPGLAKKLRRA